MFISQIHNISLPNYYRTSCEFFLVPYVSGSREVEKGIQNSRNRSPIVLDPIHFQTGDGGSWTASRRSVPGSPPLLLAIAGRPGRPDRRPLADLRLRPGRPELLLLLRWTPPAASALAGPSCCCCSVGRRRPPPPCPDPFSCRLEPFVCFGP
jgi:hypothetical protein